VGAEERGLASRKSSIATGAVLDETKFKGFELLPLGQALQAARDVGSLFRRDQPVLVAADAIRVNCGAAMAYLAQFLTREGALYALVSAVRAL